MTPEPPISVYVTIGNDSDSLSQAEWVRYYDAAGAVMVSGGATIQGEWHSGPLAHWQGHCYFVQLQPGIAPRMRERLAETAQDYGQPAICWAEVPVTLYLG